MSKILTIAMLGAALLSVPGYAGQITNSESIEFDVYLDDNKVGYHRFDVIEENGETRVQSEAQFKVRVLFVTAFRYEHSNTERWGENCLIEFAATTQANKKRIAVEGERTDSGFTVRDGDAQRQLPECVMSFAYWNPDFLRQSKLLNPQSGEYVDVNVEELAIQTLQVRGESIDARPYHITADKIELTVWYSPDGQWLALESVAKGGRILRYELV